jgi:hypothetical protein
MGRRYSIDGLRAVNAAGKTILGLTGGTTIRPRIYDMLLGSSATPADNAIQWFLQRSTAAGTSTAVTPTALDPGDPAATATAGQNHSAEPTYTAGAILFHLALNQRATHRWIADPNGPLVIPAVANNGIGLYPVNASFTGNVDATIYFEE